MSIYLEIAKEAGFCYDTETMENDVAYLEVKNMNLKDNVTEEEKEKLKIELGKTFGIEPSNLKFISKEEHEENVESEA